MAETSHLRSRKIDSDFNNPSGESSLQKKESISVSTEDTKTHSCCPLSLAVLSCVVPSSLRDMEV